uniref:Uncharacterized protein n=1 Tax=Spermophilus dauricus TaxID=99837 RepID=A0A8C9UQR8_SPEDA
WGLSHLSLFSSSPAGAERGGGRPDVPHHHADQRRPGEVQSSTNNRADRQWF